MNRITELKRKLKAIEKQQTKLEKQETALYDEITQLEQADRVTKIRKNIHTGDIRMINEGITGYHCDAIIVYEILSLTEHTRTCKINGIPSTYTFFIVKVREFAIHAYDGSIIGRIEIKQDCNIDTLLKAKKISKEDFEEFKNTVFLNPDSYEVSKWNPHKKENVKDDIKKVEK